MALSNKFAANLIFCALENEIAIDVAYRKKVSGSEITDGLPNYKIMKQIALRKRYSLIYPLMIKIAPWLIIFLFPIQWCVAIIGSVFFHQTSTESIRLLPTTLQNRELIRLAIAQEPQFSRLEQLIQPMSVFKLGRRLGLLFVLRSLFAHLIFIRAIFSKKNKQKRDMVLHARDSFLLLLIGYDISCGSDIVLTDDHYQRWSYILSHLAKDFRIVQHGFLDDGIHFPNKYGNVSKIYLRDKSFLKQFQRIYTLTESQLYSPKIEITKTPISKEALFLASSFPAIEHEIELIKIIRNNIRIPIIIKLHPAHTYDERKNQLLALADLSVEAEINPACLIFVSYNSFMEFDYLQNNMQTVSIARAGGVAQAYEEILKLLMHIDK
ncbi:hypothetical protein [Parvibium lacunae]|nr:hypothetical protein [Parvibium lacunae]